MPAPLFSEIPVTPSLMYGDIADIPRSGFKRIEIEPIAVVLGAGATVYHARIIRSPDDGPLTLCSVYLREESGGVVCIADFSKKEQALVYADAVGAACGLQVQGSIFDLQIREVPGRGYIADPREGQPFTLDPAKAALYHQSIAKGDLFAGGVGEHGRWVSWHNAANRSVDRSSEKAALLDRVLTAVRGAMGVSAPAVGSKDEQVLRGLLRNAVEDTRSDRLVVFSPELREYVVDQLKDAGYVIADHESDEDLCDILVELPGETLFGVDEIDPEREMQLLDAFGSAAGTAAIQAAAARRPLLSAGGVVAEIHDLMTHHGLESPFAGLSEEDPRSVDRPGA